MTFRNSDNGFSFSAGGFGTFNDDDGSVHISNTRFTDIHSSAHVLELAAFDSYLSLENVLFDHVSSSYGDGCAVVAYSFGGSGIALNHMTTDLATGNHFCFDADHKAANISVYNSILWSSTGGHPLFIGKEDENSHFTSFNNIYDHEFMLGTVGVSAQIKADPRWVDAAAGNYRLKTTPVSPGINSGTPISPGGEPTTDIEGNPRRQGLFPDRGAYESNYNEPC